VSSLPETTVQGVPERSFLVGDVPVVLWTPSTPTDHRPLVLLAHGGGQHKKAPAVLARAHQLVARHGFAAMAVDAPGHGGRPRTRQDERFVAAIRELAAAGQPVGPVVEEYNSSLAARAVPEWRAALDHVATRGPVGFWGVSMGAAIGLSLLAAEPRVTAAVLGLVGGEAPARAAARVTAPVVFLVQWDDEMVPRASAVALFDALASREKTLHANPGRHAAVPAFEWDAAEGFLVRHLTAAPG
jgi:dienelactone hydrolase